mgnify:FL=1
MKYIEIHFHVKADDITLVTDILAALLADAGYDSFVPEAEGMSAYIPESQYDEPALQQIIGQLPVEAEIEWSCRHYADQNWNEEWEKHYFQPIVVGNECVIHSTFHTDIPDAHYKIVIDPKMAFGTGHHETTSLMLEWILSHDFDHERVLDMGCGTAILAILARMRGAAEVTAVDIDEWAYHNALENIRLNQVDGIDVRLGDKQQLDGEVPYDTVLATINRNIHIDNMEAYASVMHPGSTIYMSGFYTQDLPVLEACAEKFGLKYQSHKEKNNWVAARFIKE